MVKGTSQGARLPLQTPALPFPVWTPERVTNPSTFAFSSVSSGWGWQHWIRHDSHLTKAAFGYGSHLAQSVETESRPVVQGKTTPWGPAPQRDLGPRGGMPQASSPTLWPVHASLVPETLALTAHRSCHPNTSTPRVQPLHSPVYPLMPFPGSHPRSLSPWLGCEYPKSKDSLFLILPLPEGP